MLVGMETIYSINLVGINPQLRGGKPCILGTSLRVIDLVMAYLFHERTPSELATDYGITLAQVHAALAYYYQNKEALDADIRQQIAKVRQYQEQQYGSRKPSLLP